MERPYGMATGGTPFDSFQMAATGDVALNAINLPTLIAIIEQHFDQMLENPVTPAALAGDHATELVFGPAQHTNFIRINSKTFDGKDLKPATLPPVLNAY